SPTSSNRLSPRALHDALPISEDASRIVAQQQPRKSNRLRFAVDATAYEIVGEDLRQDAAIHVVLRQDELQLVRVAVITDLLRLRSEEHTSELQSLAYLVCRLF